MIKFQNVTKEFKKVTAVKDVSFTIPKGKTVALIGANGSGKTTMMRMISTLITPTAGEIFVNGYNVRTEVLEVRKQIGLMLGGDAALLKRFSARENIMFYAEMQGIRKEQALHRIQELSMELNMQSYLDKRVETFSRGMRQKVLLAQTLVHEPSILLLDEPSTGLDIFATMEIRDIIKQCSESGKTILISSHNMSEVNALCDYLIIIHNGELLFVGNVEELEKRCQTTDIGAAFHFLVQEKKESNQK